MDRKDFRSLLSKLTSTTRTSSEPARRSAPGRLLASVGRAMGVASARTGLNFEHLEGRTMLEGSFANSILLTPDGTGHAHSTTASGPGANFINPSVASTDNDFYRFVAPSNDFVTVLADTSNESPASVLNTRVQVFDSTQHLIASGLSNGQLTSGFATDGWAGFVAQAGQTYFVVVSSEAAGSGPGSPGTYSLRIAATSTAVDIGGDTPETGIAREFGSPIPDNTATPPIPITPILGQLGGVGTAPNFTDRLRQDNIIYKLVLPAGSQWDNLITIDAQSTIAPGIDPLTSRRLDTRLDVFSATGQLVASNDDAGRLKDAFTTVRAHPGDTFYIRVRSDQILSSSIQKATGPFWLVIDAIADKIALDPVTRLGADPAGQFVAFGPPTVAPQPNMSSPVFQTALYEFTSQGTGLAIITVRAAGLDPLNDGALRLIDDTGTLVDFNDNFGGADPQISANLIGGKRYFVVVDGFDPANGTQFTLNIEANHTFDAASNLDDHVNTPAPLASNATQDQIDAYRRQFELATGLVWSPSFPTLDTNGNVTNDLGLRTQAVGSGRIQGPGDTDLFQFTPQVSMLQNYAGNNDGLGTALYAGGQFTVADPANPWPTTSRDLAVWDAASWWYTGAQNTDAAAGVTYGFNDNPDTAATSGPQIYTMLDYDPGTPTTPPAGMSRHWLVVGGDFDLIVPTPFGPATFKNLAVWFEDFNTGQWGWGSIGDVDGPVHALASYLPDAMIPTRDDPTVQAPTNGPVVNGHAEPYLVIGGSYTNAGGTAANNISTFDVVNGFKSIGAGTNGPVFALTTYNPDAIGAARPASAGPPPLPNVNASRDDPNMLILGGSFTTLAGKTVSNIGMWDGNPVIANGIDNLWGGPVQVGGAGRSGAGPNGTVFALATYTGWDPDGVAMTNTDAPTGDVLIIGGAFTSIHDGEGNNIAANNLAAWGFLSVLPGGSRDLTLPNYNPRAGWQAVSGGITTANANGDPIEVRALTEWDPPDINNTTIDPVLVVGGAFDVGGQDNIVAFAVNSAGAVPVSAGFGWFSGTTGTSDPTNGTGGEIYSLTTLTDAQEPGIATDLNSGVPQQVLYAGGDFTLVNNGMANVQASHIVQYSAFHDPTSGQDFFSFTALASGVDNTDPNAVPTASVFALSGFHDDNPLEWDRNDRPGERLSIVVQPIDGSFVNTRVRVFDSNFNIVYGFDKPGSETIAPPNPDPSGMLDPNTQAPGFNTALSGITVWAGETYYIEISDSTGGGTGRYQLVVTAAAEPTDLNGDGVLDDVNAQVGVPPKEGNFAAAIKIPTQLDTGDGTNLVGSDALPFKGNAIREQHISPFLNDSFVEAEDLGNISTIDDTELYYFRAEFTGTAEIRVQTIGLNDEFGEALAGNVGGTFAPQDSTYTSHLDAALRVYRNDFEQIAYEDDNMAIAGERQDDSTGVASGVYAAGSGGPNLPGTPVRDLYTSKDPRVVINVIAGNNYFIQVESGQRYANGAPNLVSDRVENIPREIDTRFATGSYRLLINAMPHEQTEIVNGQPVQDDHTNFDFIGGVLSNGLATVIPIGDNLNDPTTNGIGSILGAIQNTPLNPADQDVFTFNAPGSGSMSIRVSRVGTNNTLNSNFTLYKFDHNTGAFTVAATSAPISAGVVGATVGALTGDTFMIVLNGAGGSQGSYRVDVSGIPAVDDTADFAKIAGATTLQLFDFEGQGSANGVLETRGDTDLYRFSVSDFSLMNISVTSHAATLNPAVTVYEVSEDLAGNPIFLRIGVNDGGGVNGTATVSVPVTPNRTEVVPPPGQNRTYPYYYVLVRGANPNTDFGAYTVSVSFPPTDDHPNGDTNGDGIFDTGEFNVASRIPLDSTTGQGNAVGNIEVSTDTDLFVFTAPAGGPATVLISRPAGSTLRYKVSILDSNANVLASGIAADDPVFFTATASTTVVRGTDYFIVVQPFNDPLNPNQHSTVTGQYTVSVTAPPIDDYPNAGEFQLASTIPIDFTTGQGQLGGDAPNDPANPRLSPANDTDLFTFTTLRQGNVTITLTPFDTALGHLAPMLTLFDAAGNQLQTFSATSPLQEVSLTITNAATNVKYYVLASAVSGVPLSTLTGEYRIKVVGPAASSGGGGGGGSVDSIDFNNPTLIPLDARTGDGSASDSINPSGDRDLYTFTTTAAGKVFVQLDAPSGSLLRASIRVLNAANELQSSEVVFDSDGIPGAIANVSFDGLANKQYWVVVDGLGNSTGSYTLKVNTQPVVDRLVFPEGFASNTIREFISIINPGDVTATYTVFLRYETGDLETQVASTSIAAHSRGGLTIIDGTNYQTPGIRLNVPYSIVLESDQPLGATLAHYDFGHAIGDSMTETAVPVWDFARVERTPGSVMDFVTFYNINNFDVTATLTAYDSSGQAHTLVRNFGALRRGGFSINDIDNFPTGIFGATLSVVAASDGVTPAPVVASLSHYELVGDAAFGLLGDPNGGSTAGIITNLAEGSHLSSELDFFNPGNSPATVTVTGTYIRTALPQFTRTLFVPAKGQLTIDGATLGLSPDQPIGLKYTSDQPIVAGSDQVQLGDADSTEPATSAGTHSFFGDAYMDTNLAGTSYFETLWLANPTNAATTINVKLDFIDGTTSIIPVTINARGFAEINLTDRTTIATYFAGHSGPTWYSMDVSSATPFVSSMTHYDLTLGGGWATSGVPFGITAPLTAIP